MNSEIRKFTRITAERSLKLLRKAMGRRRVSFFLFFLLFGLNFDVFRRFHFTIHIRYHNTIQRRTRTEAPYSEEDSTNVLP